MTTNQSTTPTTLGSPAMPSGRGAPWRRYKAGLLNVVKCGLANSRSAYWRFNALSNYPVPPSGTVQPSTGHERALLATGVILNTAKLVLDAPSIEQFISKHVPIPAEFMDIVAGVFDLTDLDILSYDLAKAATPFPEVVRYAITGKLASAVRAMPAVNTLVENHGQFTKADELKLLELLSTLVAWHQLIALCRAGRNARRRFFRPTGIPVLDGHSLKRATTFAHVNRGYGYGAKRTDDVIKLYKIRKVRTLTPDEEKLITSVPGLVELGLEEEARLTAIYGSNLASVVDDLHRTARVGNRYLRRRMASFGRRALGKKAHGNTGLSKERGEDPLIILFLSCLQASAWRIDTPDEAEAKTHDKLNHVNQKMYNGVYRALRCIRAGREPELLKMPTRSTEKAREYFFLIRYLVTRGPGRSLAGDRRSPDYLDKLEGAYRVEQAKIGDGKTDSRIEAFDADAIAGFRKFYDNAVAGADASLLEEVHGPIWRQLHL